MSDLLNFTLGDLHNDAELLDDVWENSISTILKIVRRRTNISPMFLHKMTSLSSVKNIIEKTHSSSSAVIDYWDFANYIASVVVKVYNEEDISESIEQCLPLLFKVSQSKQVPDESTGREEFLHVVRENPISVYHNNDITIHTKDNIIDLKLIPDVSIECLTIIIDSNMDYLAFTNIALISRLNNIGKIKCNKAVLF